MAAAVAGFGQRVRETPALLTAAVGAALLANLASLTLTVPILFALAPTLVPAVALPLAAAGLVVLAGGLLGVRLSGGDTGASPTSESRMFRFRHAFGFALLVMAVLFVSAALNQWLGARGAMVTAMLAALVDVHAAGATIANLFAGGVLDTGQARWGIVGLLVVSSFVKTILAFASGGFAYGWRVGVGLVAMVAAAIAAVLWLPVSLGMGAA
jgi:uncharacterized membrane protein (DUF4010 family)